MMTLASRQRVAYQARKYPAYCASGVYEFEKQRNLDDEELAAWLGCDLCELYTLCLCGIPKNPDELVKVLIYIAAEHVERLFQLLCFLIAQPITIPD